MSIFKVSDGLRLRRNVSLKDTDKDGLMKAVHTHTSPQSSGLVGRQNRAKWQENYAIWVMVVGVEGSLPENEKTGKRRESLPWKKN